MADRVDASIRLGGAVTAAQCDHLVALISDACLSLEWDGASPGRSDFPVGEPLMLYGREVAWGRFDALEIWCRTHGLPFARWAGGYPGSWGAERVVFSGTGDPVCYVADEEDVLLIDREAVLRLGSVAAILGHFAAADFTIPPLVVDGSASVPG